MALPLLLTGFMGAGKSTVGRLVAERAGAPFFDLDELIETRASRSVAAIFAEQGEGAFRALEASSLDELLELSTPFVVALGGGALLDTTRRRAILARARVVALRVSVDQILARTQGSSRPLLAGGGDVSARVRALLDARREAYAEAHAHIATDARAPDAIAGDVLAAWRESTIAVPLGSRTYVVRFTANAPDQVARSVETLGGSSVHLVTDQTVASLHGEPLLASLAARGFSPRTRTVLAPGEEHKHLRSVECALTAMVESGADRGSLVVAQGGGVITDIGGFAAATLLRGVRWVGVPTTLLAMVDASVGGKTGVDLGSAKNAVGAFHQPSDVVIDASYVSTQSERDYVSGLAEVVKAGCIADAALLDLLEREAEGLVARDASLVREVAFRAVAVKASIVGRDEREAGERALLNFGHTLGHALEAQGGFNRLTHGEAVSLGMVGMLRVGEAMGLTPPDTHHRIVTLLARLGLPTDLDREPVTLALPLIGFDKKRAGSSVKAVFMTAPGQAIVRSVPVSELASRLSR